MVVFGLSSSDLLLAGVVVIGALLGAVKAVSFFDSKDNFCTKTINVMIGIFSGIMLGYHFGSSLNIWITGLIALVGAASAAIALEVVLELLPSAIGRTFKKYTKKFTD